MLRVEGLTVRYSATGPAVLRDVELALEEGELALVTGPTGSGKSTLLGTVNNLVPRFSAGTRTGRITIGGEDVSTLAPRELADRVGWVPQDPLTAFVTDTVEDELAYPMEQQGVPATQMRVRVEETLDLLGIAHLRRRSLRTLSGGEQQRVAIGSVLTLRPPLLVLDEPTSALDPVAAEDVLAVLRRLVHDLGTTVLVAEHRMERVLESADQLVRVDADGTVEQGAPADVLAGADLVPPVVELGRRLGWSPLPLSVRDARRRAVELRRELDDPVDPPLPGAPGGLRARRLTVRHGPTAAVRAVDLDLPPGLLTALVGRNGSGKSSLLWALHGAGRHTGEVTLDGRPVDGRAALVPQTPADLLYLETVAAECAEGDARGGRPPGSTLALARELGGGIRPDQHPRDLSEGQLLALVLALQLAPDTTVVLLDEPTRGLDYRAKAVLTRTLRTLAGQGRTVLVATHDVEFVAATCQRVLVLAEGELVTDGPVREVLPSSPLLAPQVSRVVAPRRHLTPDEVLRGPGAGEVRG